MQLLKKVGRSRSPDWQTFLLFYLLQFFTFENIIPGTRGGRNLISILVTDYSSSFEKPENSLYIQKRRVQALLFFFKYSMLPNLISNFNHYPIKFV